jgi:hypothetical protein
MPNNCVRDAANIMKEARMQDVQLRVGRAPSLYSVARCEHWQGTSGEGEGRRLAKSGINVYCTLKSLFLKLNSA